MNTLPAGHVTCTCGVAYSPAAWKSRPVLLVLDDGVGSELELRSCRCGTVRALRLEPLRPLAKCPSSPALPPPASAELEAAS